MDKDEISKNLRKEELLALTKKLGLQVKSSIRKDKIVEQIFEQRSVKQIKRALNPSWFSKNRDNIFGYSSVIGLLLAIIFYYWPNNSETEKSDSAIEVSIDTIEYQNLVFLATQELQKNLNLALEKRNFINGKINEIPLGNYELVHTKKFAEKFYRELIEDSYGEEEYLFQEISYLNDVLIEYNKVKDLNGLKKWNQTRDYTSDDIAFICGFLHWYIGIHAKGVLTDKLSYAIGNPNYRDDLFVNVNEVKFLHMKKYTNDGKPINSYQDFLGLID